MENKALRVGCFISYLLMIFINWYAETLPINGVTSKEVSNTVETLFTPPGYVFTIWLVIYALLFGFVIFQFVPKQKEKAYYELISFPFIITCLLNALWIILFHYYLFLWNLVLIMSLVIYLILIYIIVNERKKYFNVLEEIFIYIPFSIYLAWSTIALISNVAIVLQTSGWNGWGIEPVMWTIIVILFGLTIALVTANKYRDPYFIMVYLWAYLGLVFKYIGTSYTNILITALASCIILIIDIIYIAHPIQRN